mmetsp:Transcript_66738/g.111814  ORF Transcript_66738/g.111814 Transcript_66738/m.111814 type:complete len:80 (+) Transcript_66738:404-643(+)
MIGSRCPSLSQMHCTGYIAVAMPDNCPSTVPMSTFALGVLSFPINWLWCALLQQQTGPLCLNAVPPSLSGTDIVCNATR